LEYHKVALTADRLQGAKDICKRELKACEREVGFLRNQVADLEEQLAESKRETKGL